MPMSTSIIAAESESTLFTTIADAAPVSEVDISIAELSLTQPELVPQEASLKDTLPATVSDMSSLDECNSTDSTQGTDVVEVKPDLTLSAALLPPPLKIDTPAAESSTSEPSLLQPLSFAEGEKVDEEDVPAALAKTDPITARDDSNSINNDSDHSSDHTRDGSLSSPPLSPALSAYSSTTAASEASMFSSASTTVSPPPSRPLSRHELQRKSSFFNSKDITINSQRFSFSASESLRPIADPRFKNRFQNVLSQWRAREGN